MKRIVCGLIWAAMAARAENYALLVGISHYALGATHPWVNLEGPDNDVPRLKDALARYGFAPDHITVLLDEDASQAAILEEVRNLVKRAGPGDLALFYFSGHGTSGFDAHFKQIAQQIGPDSGALIPYDVDPTSPEKALATLVIGKRDLRPILMGLNPGARGLVIMDACYSQDSAKGLDLRGTPRYLNMREFLPPGAESAPAGSASIASIEQELLTGVGGNESPYSNILSLAAAAKNETAADMGSKLLATGKVESIDGKPHGAFTNSLLKGLDGAADTNHDGSISVDELYAFTRTDVRATFKHTPQMLEPEKGQLGEEIAFRAPDAAARPAPKPARAATPQPKGQKPVMVKLDGGATELHKRLEGVNGVILTQGDYDLLVRKTASGYELSDGSRTVIHNYGLTEMAELVGRVSAAPDVERLAQFAFANQNFNAAVEVTSPMGQGSYADGQKLSIAVKTDAPAYLLLLDIDSTGTISTLYPEKPDADKAPAKSALPVIDTKVGAPFGTEFLKLFAFQEKPVGYDRWTCHLTPAGKVKCPEFEPGSAEFRDLLTMLAQSDTGRAQAALRLVTTESSAAADGAQQREFGAPDTKSTADPAAVAYQEAKVDDIAGEYAKALEGYRAAEEKMQAPRLQAVALYQEARMAAALGRPTDASELAARSVAKLATPEGEVLVADLKRGGAPVPADTIARSLSGAGGRTMVLANEPTVDLPIEFRFDSDAMTEGGHAQATELGKALSRPELAGRRFVVVGHTDSRGAASHNQILSEQRARAVVRFLAENFGVDTKRLQAEGHGSREPISRGHTEEDYQINRRVEVRVDR